MCVRPAKTQISLGMIHPPSLIRVFEVCMKKPWVLSYPLSAQRRLIRLGGCPGWSESSLGAHSFCWFCHVSANIYFKNKIRFSENKLTKRHGKAEYLQLHYKIVFAAGTLPDSGDRKALFNNTFKWPEKVFQIIHNTEKIWINFPFLPIFLFGRKHLTSLASGEGSYTCGSAKNTFTPLYPCFLIMKICKFWKEWCSSNTEN